MDKSNGKPKEGSVSDDGFSNDKGQETVKAKDVGKTRDQVTQKRRLRLQLEELLEGTKWAPVSPNTATFDLTWDENEARSLKKKRQGDGYRTQEIPLFVPRRIGAEALATKIREIIKEIQGEVKIVTDVAKERNTKKEVKEAAVKLNSSVSQLMTTEAQELLQKAGRDRESIGGASKGGPVEWEARMNKIEKELTELKEINTTLRKEIVDLKEENKSLREGNVRLQEELKESDANEEQRHMINELIKGVDSYDLFMKVEGMTWPEECFTKCVLKPEECPMGAKDTVLWKSSNPTTDEVEGVVRKWKESFPELLELECETWETLALKSTRILRGKEEAERIRRIHIAKEGTGADLFDRIKKLRCHLVEMEVKNSVMALEDHMDIIVVAKMLECVMRGTDIQITVYSSSYKKEEKRMMRQKRFQGNAIIVKSNQGNYADTLRKIKRDILQEGNNTMVKKIRRTRKGEMLIELNEGDNGANLGNILKRREELTVKILDKDRDRAEKFIIRNLDAVITMDEIAKALKDTAENDCEEEATEVLSLREAHDCTQTAIVQLLEDHGGRIIQGSGVKLGLVQGKLERWVEVVRCFKCWGYGHRSPNCTGPDRTKYCHKCAVEGHVTKDCNNEPFCPICQRRGHKAGSGSCSKMRELFIKLRKQKEERRAARARVMDLCGSRCRIYLYMVSTCHRM